jgi:hypothetical protein
MAREEKQLSFCYVEETSLHKKRISRKPRNFGKIACKVVQGEKNEKI